MKHFIYCERIGLDDNELEVGTELKIGDYVEIDVDDNTFQLRVFKRTYYPGINQWVYDVKLIDFEV